MGNHQFFRFTVLLAFLIGNLPVQAQSLCGTRPSQWLIDYDLNNPAALARTSLPKANKVFSVYVYICRDVEEQPVTTAADATAMVNRANTVFAPIGFSFNVCKIIDVPDYRYRTIDEGVMIPELMVLHYQPEVINLYVTSSASPVEGLASMPGPAGQGDYIAVGADALDPSSIQLIHQLGHFFGLYHTGELTFGPEPANGGNCTITGDLLCDTPADPNGTFVGDCIHQLPITDPAGVRYAPPYDNYMSGLVDEGCGCRFTNDQYHRMYNQYVTNRSYLK